jgi:hypothetical protein
MPVSAGKSARALFKPSTSRLRPSADCTEILFVRIRGTS